MIGVLPGSVEFYLLVRLVLDFNAVSSLQGEDEEFDLPAGWDLEFDENMVPVIEVAIDSGDSPLRHLALIAETFGNLGDRITHPGNRASWYLPHTAPIPPWPTRSRIL